MNPNPRAAVPRRRAVSGTGVATTVLFTIITAALPFWSATPGLAASAAPAVSTTTATPTPTPTPTATPTGKPATTATSEPSEAEPNPTFEATYDSTCAGVTAGLTNGKTRSAYTLLYRIGRGPIQTWGENVQLDALESAPTREVPGTPGAPLEVSWQPVDANVEDDFYTWDRPDECRAPFTTTYVSTCTGITATITNGPAAGEYALLWTRSGIDGVSGVPGTRVQLEPREQHTVSVKAPNGRGFSVSWQVTEVHDIDDTFVTWRKPVSCGDAELPVTGNDRGPIMAVSGLLLIALGALTIRFMRWRPHSAA
jgi:hypothetical protein